MAIAEPQPTPSRTIQQPAQGDALNGFIRHAMRVPLLSAGRENELTTRWKAQGDKRALHELTTAHLRLVVALAQKYRHYGLPIADLIQEGTIGLMQAAARFDPKREVRFSTYAGWWIRAAIQDFVLRNWSIVRTGTTAAQKSLFFNLRRLRAQIGDTHEARFRIADALGVRVRDVEAMETRILGADRSLNAPAGDNADAVLQWQDLLVCVRDTPDALVAETLDGQKWHLWLEDALARLTARERAIIKARRLRDDAATLKTLGKKFGLSKERVRQIEHEAMAKLRTILEEIATPPNRQ